MQKKDFHLNTFFFSDARFLSFFFLSDMAAQAPPPPPVSGAAVAMKDDGDDDDGDQSLSSDSSEQKARPGSKTKQKDQKRAEFDKELERRDKKAEKSIDGVRKRVEELSKTQVKPLPPIRSFRALQAESPEFFDATAPKGASKSKQPKEEERRQQRPQLVRELISRLQRRSTVGFVRSSASSAVDVRSALVLDSKSQSEIIRTMRVDIPILTARFLQRICRQGGEFNLPGSGGKVVLPTCCFGADCEVQHPTFYINGLPEPGRRGPMCAWMTPQEYVDVVINRKTAVAMSLNNRPCVICESRTFSEVHIGLQNHPEVHLDELLFFQSFQVYSQRHGGFFQCYTTPPGKFIGAPEIMLAIDTYPLYAKPLPISEGEGYSIQLDSLIFREALSQPAVSYSAALTTIASELGAGVDSSFSFSSPSSSSWSSSSS